MVVLLLGLQTASAQITLNGNLLTDAEKPVADTKVSVAAGPSNTTDSKGQFSIKLSLDFIEGERVILVVHKEGWVINSPLDGEWNLPAKKLQEVPTQYTKVIIVPKGSKALWTHARIEKHIALLSDEIATLKKEGDTPKPIDFSYYLSEWADKYGFTPEQVKAAFDQWAKDVEHSEDYRTLGLRAFYQKNFATAAENFTKSARQGQKILKNLQEEARRQTLRTYEDWKLAGNSLSNLYQFEEALAKYDSASQLVPKESYAPEWAEIRFFIGITKYSIGIRVEGEKANRMLQESEAAYREALQVCTREQLPQAWASIQNNLGLALFLQGGLMEGEKRAKLLTQAVEALRAALTVYTRERMPQEWASTQNNLGTVLWALGNLTGGDEGMRLLLEAIRAYGEVLRVITRGRMPQQWALTQMNLGKVFWELGTTGEEDAELLREAAKGIKNALMVYTRERVPPQDWAATQHILGSVLWKLGTLTAGEEGARLLHEAVTTFNLALEVRTFEHLPVGWAKTQNNLAKAYTYLEDWPNVAACHANVLKVYSDDEQAYQTAGYLYHEVLFNFPEAFALNQQWLTRHPNDLSAQCDFAEKHFTTGRFAECEKLLAAQLLNLKVEPRVKVALRAIQIANALALGHTGKIPSQLDTLQATIASQPDTFKMSWTFNGTKHFISQNEKLASNRAWLLQLFQALEIEEGREAILAALREVREKFKAVAGR